MQLFQEARKRLYGISGPGMERVLGPRFLAHADRSILPFLGHVVPATKPFSTIRAFVSHGSVTRSRLRHLMRWVY